MKAQFILYVSDHPRSTAFYSSVLGDAPVLDVPRMTEFRLAESAVLGLMPEAGIVALLGEERSGFLDQLGEENNLDRPIE